MPPDGDVAHHTLTAEKPRMSRAAKPTASARPARHVPAHVPGFSIEVLGHQLALTSHHQHLLDILSHNVGQEEPGIGAFTSKTLLQRHVKRAEAAVDDHYYALRDLILRSRPVTVGDVATQLMATDLYLAYVSNSGAEEDERTQAEKVVSRVLCGAVRCLAENHGLKLAELGRWNTAYDVWPAVDLSEVDPERNETDTSIDGSVAEWER